MTRKIENIIIHEADTPTGKEFSVKDIDQWHIERGFHRNDNWRIGFNPSLFACGYHYVIKLDGTVETGRHEDEVGAHCSGLNSTSIGICLIGKGKYTPAQWKSLQKLVEGLKAKYENAKIKGHYETPSGSFQGKSCPDFNVSKWVLDKYVPEEKNVT
jgi:hypothetical protein